MDTDNAHRFDWQAEPEQTFAKWMLPTVLSGFTGEQFEQLGAATNQYRDVELAILVNGHPVNAANFLDAVERLVANQAQREAQAMVEGAGEFAKLREALLDIDTVVTEQLRTRLAQAGIELPDEER